MLALYYKNILTTFFFEVANRRREEQASIISGVFIQHTETSKLKRIKLLDVQYKTYFDLSRHIKNGENEHSWHFLYIRIFLNAKKKKYLIRAIFSSKSIHQVPSKHCAGKEMHRMKDIPEISEEHQASRGARKLQNSIRRKAVQNILGTEKKQQQILL